MTIEKWLPVIGAALGLLGFAVGLYEYRVAQKWKKSEFAAGLLGSLSSDPELAMCCLFLDWYSRTIPTPAQYDIGRPEKSFEHNWARLAVAMLPEKKQWTFKWPLVVYIDAFDHFFAFLEQINQYISTKLIAKQDVASLKYWLDCLYEPRFKPDSDDLEKFLGPGKHDELLEEGYEVFRGFIEGFGHEGVIQLMQRFGLASQWGVSSRGLNDPKEP